MNLIALYSALCSGRLIESGMNGILNSLLVGILILLSTDCW
ncbi:hypothetical protein [uncultured Dysgonomonas sp.]|nr:hypothetical protein [uncultured Dysgonomonas sp.]